METYRVSNETVQHLRTIFSQDGKGLDIDRYIYNQQGAGLGSFFANLFHRVLPIAKTALSTAATIAKPHLQQAGNQLLEEGANFGAKKLGELVANRKRKRDILDD